MNYIRFQKLNSLQAKKVLKSDKRQCTFITRIKDERNTEGKMERQYYE